VQRYYVIEKGLAREDLIRVGRRFRKRQTPLRDNCEWGEKGAVSMQLQREIEQL